VKKMSSRAGRLFFIQKFFGWLRIGMSVGKTILLSKARWRNGLDLNRRLAKSTQMACFKIGPV
jgi:hypothetical protein